MLTSLLWKLVYGVAAALALALTTFLEGSTDPQLWSLKSLVVVATPLVISAVKKAVAAQILGVSGEGR
jgi:hypothetical protein